MIELSVMNVVTNTLVMKTLMSWMVLITVLILPSYQCLSRINNQPPRLILEIMRLFNFLFGILYDPPNNDGCGAISDTVHNMIKIDVTCYSIINFI